VEHNKASENCFIAAIASGDAVLMTTVRFATTTLFLGQYVSSLTQETIAYPIQRVAWNFQHAPWPLLVMHPARDCLYQLRAGVGDLPLSRLKHLVHQRPAADSVIRCQDDTEIIRLKDFVDLVRDRWLPPTRRCSAACNSSKVLDLTNAPSSSAEKKRALSQSEKVSLSMTQRTHQEVTHLHAFASRPITRDDAGRRKCTTSVKKPVPPLSK